MGLLRRRCMAAWPPALSLSLCLFLLLSAPDIYRQKTIIATNGAIKLRFVISTLHKAFLKKKSCPIVHSHFKFSPVKDFNHYNNFHFGRYFCVIHFCVIHRIFKKIDEVTQSLIQNFAVTYSVILAVIYSVILFFQ